MLSTTQSRIWSLAVGLAKLAIALAPVVLVTALTLSPNGAMAKGGGGHHSAEHERSTHERSTAEHERPDRDVHVNDYTKKDGTYVHPYTRSSPGTGFTNSSTVAEPKPAHEEHEERTRPSSTIVEPKPIHVQRQQLEAPASEEDVAAPKKSLNFRPAAREPAEERDFTDPATFNSYLARDPRGRIERSTAAKDGFKRGSSGKRVGDFRSF